MRRIASSALAIIVALAAAAVGAQDKSSYEVAVIRWDPADIYFNGVQLGQEQERQRIEQEDGIEIEFRVFGANDVSAQRNALDAQLARGVDGVLLVPWRGEAMRGALDLMKQDGIPYVTSNAWVPAAEQVFVAFDNEEAGRLAGEALVARLNELKGEDWPEQGGVIIELRCIITASFDIGRHDGYHSVLDAIVAEHPNVTIETREAGCDGGKARQAVDDIMSRYGPDSILAIASIDGTMGVGGAVPALQAQGRLLPQDDPQHVPIATVDGTLPELEAIGRGDIDHISVQPATGEGIVTMRLLYEMMKQGTTEIDEAQAKDVLTGDELWQPVEVIETDAIQGPWFKTKTYGVPGDVAYDDPKNWAIQMYEAENGKLPDFVSK
jgi:ABC-type sugar transport system substrate-binding protein